MDALAVLSENEDEDSDEAEPEAASSPDEGHAWPKKIDFGSLQRAGYSGAEALQNTEMYRHAGPPAPVGESVAPIGDGNLGAPVAVSTPVEQSTATASELPGDTATRDTLERAAIRDRKRAGVRAAENNRQKNARKMKLGQAQFSLKDDRDCVNPFVDHSQDPHVRSFGGKRVDERASVKQISARLPRRVAFARAAGCTQAQCGAACCSVDHHAGRLHRRQGSLQNGDRPRRQGQGPAQIQAP